MVAFLTASGIQSSLSANTKFRYKSFFNILQKELFILDPNSNQAEMTPSQFDRFNHSESIAAIG